MMFAIIFPEPVLVMSTAKQGWCADVGNEKCKGLTNWGGAEGLLVLKNSGWGKGKCIIDSP